MEKRWKNWGVKSGRVEEVDLFLSGVKNFS